MAEKEKDNGYSMWYSTYGTLTTQRVLERLGIRLPHDEFIKAVKDVDGIYYQVLRVPMMNIFNGIIYQQAYDYQVYAQKLFIDYRLSPEFAKEADSPGGGIRADLDELYDRLLEQGKAFNEELFVHYRLISESQLSLIDQVAQLKRTKSNLSNLMDNSSFNETMLAFKDRAEIIMGTFRHYRTEFYQLILQITDRFTMLVDYHYDLENAERQRMLLRFDMKIGDA